MDKIILRELSCQCIIGTFEHERTTKQSVVLTLELFTDLQPAGISGNLADSVDYFELRNEIFCFVENSQFFLVEQLGEKIAEICLSKEKVKAVRIVLEKPTALQNVKTVAIEIERKK